MWSKEDRKESTHIFFSGRGAHVGKVKGDSAVSSCPVASFISKCNQRKRPFFSAMALGFFKTAQGTKRQPLENESGKRRFDRPARGLTNMGAFFGVGTLFGVGFKEPAILCKSLLRVVRCFWEALACPSPYYTWWSPAIPLGF